MSSLFQGGYLRVGRLLGAPVRLHWTTPIGAFVGTGIVEGTGLLPAAWGAFVGLILIHELGHAVLGRRHGLTVTSIDVHGAGGMCRFLGQTTALGRAKIAWGGVVAQALLLVATTLLAPVAPKDPMVGQVVRAWTATNLLVIGLNLLPIRGLDGAEAWTLFRWSNLRAWWREGKRAQQRRVERELRTLERGKRSDVDDKHRWN